LANVPDFFDRAKIVLAGLDAATKTGFSLSAESLNGIGKAEARRARWGNLALWVIAAALVWSVWH